MQVYGSTVIKLCTRYFVGLYRRIICYVLTCDQSEFGDRQLTFPIIAALETSVRISEEHFG